MRVLVAGLGAAGQRHVRNLRHLLGRDVEISAYRTQRQVPLLTEQLEVVPDVSVEDRYSIRSHDTLDAALAERPDVVFVCNPTSLHITVALAAAEAGCHLFIEKPLADSLQGIDDLVREVERRRLVAVVGYQWRFHPCLQLLQWHLAHGTVGRLLAVEVTLSEHLPHWHRYEDYRLSYAARRALGGGVLLSQIHELDYVQWLFGRPLRLFAVGGHLSSLDVDTEDTANILMACEREGRPLPVHVHQDFVQRSRSRSCRVAGEDGTIAVDLLASTLAVADADGRHVESFKAEAFDRNQLFLDQLGHFLQCLEGRAAPLVPIESGIVSLRMALAARESIETGRAVELAS